MAEKVTKNLDSKRTWFGWSFVGVLAAVREREGEKGWVRELRRGTDPAAHGRNRDLDLVLLREFHTEIHVAQAARRTPS